MTLNDVTLDLAIATQALWIEVELDRRRAESRIPIEFDCGQAVTIPIFKPAPSAAISRLN